MSDYSQFIARVIKVVRFVPAGKVVSYGQVAVYMGVPRAARQVGGALKHLEGVDLPWWRVLNNEGKVTIRGNWYNDKVTQRKLLEAEGVSFMDDFQLDMKRYRFIADYALLRRFRLSEEYISLIRGMYGF